MKTEHLNNLSFEIPDDWIIEKNEKNFLIHKNKGRGVLTISFDNINNLNHNIGNHISDMLRKICRKNKIKVDKSIYILDISKKDKTTAYTTGITQNNTFIKIWIVAENANLDIVWVTYNSKKNNREVKTVDKIVNSFKFENS